MKYEYYGDPKNPKIRDPRTHEGRGSITQLEDGRWRSEYGRIFATQDEAADDNGPVDPPKTPQAQI